MTSLSTRAAGAALLLACAIVTAACGTTNVTPAAPGATAPAATAPATSASNDDGDTTPAVGGGVCNLVDSALAAKVLGEPVDRGSSTTDPASGVPRCTYRTSGSGNWMVVQVTSSISRDDWDARQATSHMDRADQVDGLGEIAYLAVDHKDGLRLSAFGNDHAVEVFAHKPYMDVHRSLAPEEIVRTVLTELG